MLRAKVTASRHKASRTAGSRFGAGAISITFWCRRCTEQSRSNRCTTSPVASARIWTSMCRGRSTACSRKTVGSPKAPSASRMAALRAAMREADGAFGDPTVFLERAVLRPRHIEVQILADATGEVVHLFERDCSVQRRHQKVIEIAPAPNLDPAIRDALCRDAVTFARSIGY